MPEFLPFVRRWFAETFSEPTRPQREGWEAIASGRDTLIVAPTGSGKTLAAFLWALDHLHRLGLDGRLEDRVYVVYVSPLRALNNDIEKNLREPPAAPRAHHDPGVAVHPAHQRGLPARARPGALRDRRRGPRADGQQARRAP